MKWMASQHVRYPEWAVRPPKLRWVTGFWSLLFWTVFPMLATSIALVVIVTSEVEKGDFHYGFIMPLLFIWPFTFVVGKSWAMCYGCWHVYGDMKNLSDLKRRRYCGMWVTVCLFGIGFIITYDIAAYIIVEMLT